MKKNIVTVLLVAIAVYPLLMATSWFSAPFMVSWGMAKPWPLQLIIFLMDTPFSLTSREGGNALEWVFVNTAFWSLIAGGIYSLLTNLINKRK